jgi:hypothetical protein
MTPPRYLQRPISACYKTITRLRSSKTAVSASDWGRLPYVSQAYRPVNAHGANSSYSTYSSYSDSHDSAQLQPPTSGSAAQRTDPFAKRDCARLDSVSAAACSEDQPVDPWLTAFVEYGEQ